MADAAGLNSFVRQIGGSVGLTIFATLFTNYALEAHAALATHVTSLRPEVIAQIAGLKGAIVAHGGSPALAQVFAGAVINGRLWAQATVLSFNRVFIFQGLLFLGVLPLLFLVRVPRISAPQPVEMPME